MTEGARLFQALRNGDRASLARAITLVESTRPQDAASAAELVRLSLAHAGRSVRIGITGIPGAGKSTLIEAAGSELLRLGKRLAVLAIDPSSARSGGSILGDKTRMERLSRSDAVFIRPSPTAGVLGGVGRRTRETILLCEAAGYDRVLIETVGTGQNELAVDRMTDLNVVLAIGGAGDELQGIKRGIMESADIIALNKTDGVQATLNQRAATDLRLAIHLLPPREHGERAQVLLCSAQDGTGITDLVAAIEGLAEKLERNGATQARRGSQNGWWLHEAISERLLQDLFALPAVRQAMPRIEEDVRQGRRSPFDAADELVRLFRTASGPPREG